MVKFERLRYKNILSTGNHWNVIDLDTHGTSLIIGSNGAGKSTILDALCFVLYGKAFRGVTLPSLVNSINKTGMMVEVSFSTRGKNYKVIRGIGPKKFEIWCDDVLLNQDSKNSSYQEELETKILQMNFKTFGQIVILGSSTFVPFMQLKAMERRNFIEDLLDLHVFSRMSSILKEQMSQTKTDIIATEHDINMCKNNIQHIKKEKGSVKKVKMDTIKKLKGNIQKIISECQVLIDDNEKYAKQIENLIGTISDEDDVSKNHSALRSEILIANRELKTLEENNEFLIHNAECPTCKQIIEDEFKKDHLDQNNTVITKKKKDIEKMSNEMSTVSSRIDEIADVSSKINTIRGEISSNNSELKIQRKTIQSIKDDVADIEKDLSKVVNDDLDGYVKELRDLETQMKALHEEYETQVSVSHILKDGGIKSRIVKQYIPIINTHINNYLSKMDFFINFELDDQFKETIKSRHRDEFSYPSFSEGEKAKIDIALMLTWRTIARLRNSATTNLLIFDEIFDGSLDSDSLTLLSNTLNSDVDNSNIFVISHKVDQYLDRFDRVLKFKKVKNFSIIEEIT